MNVTKDREYQMRQFMRAFSLGVVSVKLDPRQPGVRVPRDYEGEEMLQLNFNHAQGRQDLKIDEQGISETLSFRGVWLSVSIPWAAIYMIGSFADGGIYYQVDPPAAPAPKRSHLRLVKS